MIKRLIRFGGRLITSRTTTYNNSSNAAYFATLYQLTKKYLPNQQVYKSTSLKFDNQGMKMLAYQFSPQVLENNSPSFNKPRRILAGKMFNLSFLAEVGDGMQEDAWSNRKIISFNLRESFQLMKIVDQKLQKVVIEQETAHEQSQSQKYSLNIQLAHNKQKQEVGIWVSHNSMRNQKKTHLWELNFVLRFNQYLVLCEWIRSGIYYTSGAAMMIEYSKQQQILAHSTQRNTQYQKYADNSTAYKKKK